MIKLRGSYTAMITPMNDDGTVDYDQFRKNVVFQMKSGISGIAPLGTTGETPTLLEEEEEVMIKIAVEESKKFLDETGKKVPVIIGTGSNCTKDAVRYTERAKKLGADVALVVTPYYNKPSKEGIYQHFAAVSKAGMPILVYNIAGRTGVNITTDTLERIAELPNVIGVKEASGNINQMMEVITKIKSKKPDFAVLSGDDGLTLPLIGVGGDGVVSVVSNLAPDLVSKMVSDALSGNLEEARKIHYRLLPFFKAAFVDGNPSSIKYALKVKKMDKGFMRLPLVEINDNAKKVVENALKECEL